MPALHITRMAYALFIFVAVTVTLSLLSLPLSAIIVLVLFAFECLPYRLSELNSAKHTNELKPTGDVVLCVDTAHMGVGGEYCLLLLLLLLVVVPVTASGVVSGEIEVVAGDDSWTDCPVLPQYKLDLQKQVCAHRRWLFAC